MNTQYLKYYIEIVECRSISKAASKLLVNYSSLIYALNALENEAGQKLVNRDQSGITMTRMGEKIYTDSKIIMNIFDSWSNTIDDRHIIYYLDSVPCVYNTFLPDMILHLSEVYPELRIISNQRTALCSDFKKNDTMPNMFISTVYDNEFHDEAHLLKMLNLTKVKLFKSRMVFYYNKHCFRGKKTSITKEEVRKMPVFTNSILYTEENEFYYLFDPAKTTYMPNQAQIFYAISKKRSGTILPAFLKNFTRLVDDKSIDSCPIDGYNTYANVALYYSPHLTNDYYSKKIIEYISGYDFLKTDGIEPYK